MVGERPFVRTPPLIPHYRASAYSFQATHGTDMETLSLGGSKIQSYLGIDKREGLVAIAKRLLQSKLFALPCCTFSYVMCRRQA